MSMSTFECPICGRTLPADMQEVADNGTIICSDCKSAEDERLSKEDT